MHVSHYFVTILLIKYHMSNRLGIIPQKLSNHNLIVLARLHIKYKIACCCQLLQIQNTYKPNGDILTIVYTKTSGDVTIM